MSNSSPITANDNNGADSVPKALRYWFVVHFAADILFAIPLMLTPLWFLGLLGWETIDPIATRLAAAALFGIGIESLLARTKPREAYRPMLNLKIIWSCGAIVGILLSRVSMGEQFPAFGWLVLGIFAAFNGLWIYWRLRLFREG